MIPFAVVGSERNVIIDGKSVRGRKNRWGVVNVEDETHCEFVYLRNFLTRYVSLSGMSSRHRSILTTRTPLGHTCRTSSRQRRRFITRRSAQNSCSRSRSRRTRDPRRRSRPRKGRRSSQPCPRSVHRCAYEAYGATGSHSCRKAIDTPFTAPACVCLVLLLNAPCLVGCCWTVPLPLACLFLLASVTLV